jgi:ABC-2 type transport system ATP-binding protein
LPVVSAEDLGVRRGRHRWVFRHLDLSAAEGELVAVTGPAGSGRTSLALALAGHFRTDEGRIVREGSAALGHVSGVHEPEPALTVVEHLEERLLLLGLESPQRTRLRPVTRAVQGRRLRRERAAAALAPYADELPPDAPGRDLSPYQKQLLGLALAELADPALVVADDVDTGLDTAERARLLVALRAVADSGRAVVVTARETDPTSALTRVEIGGPA